MKTDKMEKIMKFTLFICISFLASSALYAQQKIDYTAEDKVIFDNYVTSISPYREKSIGKVLEKTAEFFLNTPYVAHTLERTSTELLIVNLRELDCTTFVENVIALSRTAKSDDFSFCRFTDELRNIRYRNGKINDYDSRLHYASDWIFENEKHGVLKNISKELGGMKDARKINFMSTHTDAYIQLKSDADMRVKITTMEEKLNNRQGFYYLPKQKITLTASSIPHMALIAFTTSVKGLDASHMAFAYKKDGKLTFIHASSVAKKVIINKKALSDYCASQKSCTGIMVVPIENLEP